jgi:hypothetical protein
VKIIKSQELTVEVMEEEDEFELDPQLKMLEEDQGGIFDV